MTAAENTPETPWEPSPAFPQLAALAAAMRPEWSRQDLWDSITAAKLAGWSWRDTYREVMRLAWDEDEKPSTLRSAARRPGPAQPAPLDPEAKAALLEQLAEAAQRTRTTGGQTRLTPDNDPRHGAGDSIQRKWTDGL